MNRRALLTGLLALPAAALIAPDLLLPSRKWFLSPVGGWPVVHADGYEYGVYELVVPIELYGKSVADSEIVKLLERRMNEAMNSIADRFWNDWAVSTYGGIGGIGGR